MRARELGRTPIVVGDRVGLVGDLSGKPDTLARIVRVEERTTVLRRTADDTDPVERLVVANAEQLVIVTAVADPMPRTGFVDRCLVAAYAGGLSPLLCLTKADLADPGPFAAHYAELELPVLITRRDEPERLASAGRRARRAGLGAGRALRGGQVDAGERAASRTPTGRSGVVSGVGKGRHTTVAALALPLPADRGGWVVDTPGVRSFGLAHVTPDDVIAAFDDLAAAIDDCPRGCGHLGPPADPECALDTLVEQGQLRAGPARRAAPGARRVALDLSQARPAQLPSAATLTRIARHATRMVDGPDRPRASCRRRNPTSPSRELEPGHAARGPSGPYTLLSVLGTAPARPRPPGPDRQGRAGRGPGDPAASSPPTRGSAPACARRSTSSRGSAGRGWPRCSTRTPTPTCRGSPRSTCRRRRSHVLLSRCGPLSVDGVRRLGVELAEALEAIHDAGAVHRDLKPANVLVTGRRPARRRRRHRAGPPRRRR